MKREIGYFILSAKGNKSDRARLTFRKVNLASLLKIDGRRDDQVRAVSVIHIRNYSSLHVGSWQ